MTSVVMSYLSIAAMLALTTLPVLIPAIITAVHAVMHRSSRPDREARYLPAASRRLAAA